MPIHDLFAMAEACLLADVIQMAIDSDIPFVPFNLHKDVRTAIATVSYSFEYLLHASHRRPPRSFTSPPRLLQHVETVGAPVGHDAQNRR